MSHHYLCISCGAPVGQSQKTLVLCDYKTIIAASQLSWILVSRCALAFVLVHLCTTCAIFFFFFLVWEALSRQEAAFVYCPTSKAAVFFLFVCSQTCV